MYVITNYKVFCKYIGYRWTTLIGASGCFTNITRHMYTLTHTHTTPATTIIIETFTTITTITSITNHYHHHHHHHHITITITGLVSIFAWTLSLMPVKYEFWSTPYSEWGCEVGFMVFESPPCSEWVSEWMRVGFGAHPCSEWEWVFWSTPLQWVSMNFEAPPCSKWEWFLNLNALNALIGWCRIYKYMTM